MAESTTPELRTFKHLAVSRSSGLTHVQFKQAKTFGEEKETVSDLREDFAQLADLLGRHSKVLLDFAGVVLFSSASINALILFNKKLQTKGSRIALCSLDPTARESFFVAG